MVDHHFFKAALITAAVLYGINTIGPGRKIEGEITVVDFLVEQFLSLHIINLNFCRASIATYQRQQPITGIGKNFPAGICRAFIHTHGKKALHGLVYIGQGTDVVAQWIDPSLLGFAGGH